jgi:hypothetical protein
MNTFLLAVADPLLVFYALPLIVAVSLVYAATRHEQPREILVHSLRVGLWILGFMAAILVVLLLISWWL